MPSKDVCKIKKGELMSDLVKAIENKTTKNENSKPKALESQFQQTMDMYKNDLKSLVPEGMDVQKAVSRMIRIIVGAVNQNDYLRNCDQNSLIVAASKALQLGLEVNTTLGQAYIIPYKGQAQFQIGYQGMLNLAYRTGIYLRISAHTVYEDDEFDYELGSKMEIFHKPSKKFKKNRRATHYYAIYKTVNGGERFEVMSKEEMDEHRDKYAKSSSIWDSHPNAQGEKTVLKRLMKTAPKSVKLSAQLSADETSSKDLKDAAIDIPSTNLGDKS